MIDFRYHLVSLVAVFLALAIGIVLGAGPLQEDLGSALTDQVAELREERVQLRSDLGDAQGRSDQALADAEDYAENTLPAVVAGRMSGAHVALVITPQGSAQLRDAAIDTLELAGGEVVSITQLQDGWTDPGQAATREELAATALQTVQLPEPLADTPDLPAVLAAALTGQTGAAGRPGAIAALDQMTGAGLISIETLAEDPSIAPDAVVVIGGGGSAVLAAPDATAEERLEQEVRTVGAVGSSGVPAVVLGDVASAESATGAARDALVTGVRADADAAEVISTVDNGSSALGRTAFVLALVLATTDEVGAFGTAEDAASVVPDTEDLPTDPWPGTEEDVTPPEQELPGSGGSGVTDAPTVPVPTFGPTTDEP